MRDIDIEEEAKTLGKRLHFARLAKGYTLDQLAKLTGIDKSNLSRAERAKATLRPASLASVAYFLGMDYESLSRLNAIVSRHQDQAEGIGSKIYSLRQAQMMTLTALAFRANVDAGNLSRIESGKTQPSQATIDRICAAFQVSEQELMQTPPFSPNNSMERLFPSRKEAFSPPRNPPLERIDDAQSVRETGVDAFIWEAIYFRVQDDMPAIQWQAGDILVVSPQPTPKNLDIVLAQAAGAYFPLCMRRWNRGEKLGGIGEEQLYPELLHPGSAMFLNEGFDVRGLDGGFDLVGVVMQVRRWLKQ